MSTPRSVSQVLLASKSVMKIGHAAKANKHHPRYYFTCVSKEITCRRQSGLEEFYKAASDPPSPPLPQTVEEMFVR